MSDEAFSRFIELVPLAREYGYRLVSRTEGEVVLAAPVRPEHLQVEEVVHGGLLATLADTTAVCLLYPHVPDDQSMTSIEFKLNFLRPARAGGGDLVSRAWLVKRGRTVSLCDVEVEQGDRLVCKGLFTYLVSPR